MRGAGKGQQPQKRRATTKPENKKTVFKGKGRTRTNHGNGPRRLQEGPGKDFRKNSYPPFFLSKIKTGSPVGKKSGKFSMRLRCTLSSNHGDGQQQSHRKTQRRSPEGRHDSDSSPKHPRGRPQKGQGDENSFPTLLSLPQGQNAP